MGGPATDNQLVRIASGPEPATIGDVLSRMQGIDDLLPNGDGLKWFNLLYMRVTQQVDSHPPPGGWEDPVWLTRLDVVFARFYFAAIPDWLTGSAITPSSCKPLFGARFRSRNLRIVEDGSAHRGCPPGR